MTTIKKQIPNSKDIIDVEIIVRCFNEEDWIFDCIKAIEKQDCWPTMVTIADNNSTDSTTHRAAWLKESTSMPIKVETYKNSEEGYRPGKILNHFCLKSKSEYVICLSAHCIPANNMWLRNLFEYINTDKNIAAVYGKQIPTSKSDPRDSRDLYWTFGHEDKISIKDPFFHNANSIIRKEVIEKNPFREDIKNIEDRVWAKEIIEKQNMKIGYCSRAIVFHEHGIHQSGAKKRAEQIVEITEKYVENKPILETSGNMVCIIPIKLEDKLISDKERNWIKVSAQTAKECGFTKEQIICSITNCSVNREKVEKILPEVTILIRKEEENDSGQDPDMRDILLRILDQCLEVGMIFRDMLVLEPKYCNRSTESIERLIRTYNKSNYMIALFDAPLNFHVWHKYRSNLIRIDSFENTKSKQELLRFSPRGLGMIIRISKLRQTDWLDSEIEFCNLTNLLEALPADKLHNG